MSPSTTPPHQPPDTPTHGVETDLLRREMRLILARHLPFDLQGAATAQTDAVMALLQRRTAHPYRALVTPADTPVREPLDSTGPSVLPRDDPEQPPTTAPTGTSPRRTRRRRTAR